MPKAIEVQGVSQNRLELLKGVSGAFRPRVLTALMGISGAGKTTLLDVLAGRKNSRFVEGNITVSGYPKRQETFARVSGYCEQNDIHSPLVTVYESLLYSAWLRLPPAVHAKTREVYVEEVMELVELTTLRDALIGFPNVTGLSTEQCKRLTIAVELVANPSIIFMDEPTTGLDARAAVIVMRTVRNIVDTGRTVVCTIHLPSNDIFESFDEDIPEIDRIEDGYNPATWALEQTTGEKEGVRTAEQGIFSGLGALYTTLLFLGFNSASVVQPVIVAERTIHYKERAAGMYSALPYAMAQVAMEIPYTFAMVFMNSAIVYPMIGYEWTSTKFFHYLLYQFFTVLSLIYYGMMVIGISPNLQVSFVISGALYTTWNLFTGFVIPQKAVFF
nr:abc transporter g family member 36 [Quercus suber]